MNDAEWKLIEQENIEKVRKALKLITSGEIYDEKDYLNEKGYKALEEIEGLDLFWICDPMIKFAKESEKGRCEITVEQILNEIYRNGCTDEVFLALSKRVISEKEELNKKIAGNNATLRLIGKITKDKTVKEVLEE